VSSPTIERLQTSDGVVWHVTVSGMTLISAHDWQAWWLYEMARAAYFATNIGNG